ncbi:Rha family transcriptional regulator [Cytobacillus oceanisediminis]|uniref:Rha family transcriptional regulator n=1 Tax=Cytobacillus oceanisediminis TaxID=665099 RepID=UPI00203CA708|nr:Rha family transcriptional regulator [Cytobacillus oceanisediminis]MCM3242725.1 Rha family transcriptional regulator [Cytobacillus oceanisediminis]
MNQLNVINQDGQLLVDSREVAEMVGREHSNLMRDIRGYIGILENSNLNFQDFFIPSTYKTEGNNKTYDCFLLTRKGCDMVANKMTGEKGVLFTAAYVTRFEEMENQLKPKTQLEILQASINQLVDQERRLSVVETRLIETEKKQNNLSEIISLNNIEWRKKVNGILQRIAKAMGGYDAYRDIRNESYKVLEQRAACKLSVRLTNKKQKMALEGVAKSKIDKATKMDVIADDARLTEIYLAIVKEMAIKYKVDLQEV